MGYNSRATGGEETHVYQQGGWFKVHVFRYNTESLTVFLTTIMEVSCSGVRPSQPTVWIPGTYPIESGTACPTGLTVKYGVDTQLNGTETRTYKQCIPCLRGAYQNESGSDFCRPCPPKTYQDGVASTACWACPTGSASDQGLEACLLCQGALVLQDGDCRPCPNGTFRPMYLPTPVCWTCPLNMWSDQRSNGCQVCPAGSTSAGGTTMDGCKCAAGLFMQRDCKPCPPGATSVKGATNCTLCPLGTYANANASSVCHQCPGQGVTPYMGATGCTLCRLGQIRSTDNSTCEACPAGKACPSTGVIACPQGTYSLATGLTSVSDCPPCPADNYCVYPDTIVPCPSYTESPPGTFDIHNCVCKAGFTCQSLFTAPTQTVLNVTLDTFKAQQAAIIRDLALRLGVDPSRIRIISVTGA